MDRSRETDFGEVQNPSRRKFLKGAGAVGIVAGLSRFGLGLGETKAESISSVSYGVETYGINGALTQDQLNSFIAELNNNYSEMRDDTYYGTFFIDDDAYKAFQTVNGETAQEFIARNVGYMSKMLQEANPSLKGGVKLRRLVVVQPGIQTPMSHHLGWLNNGIKDSDGSWRIQSDYQPKQDSHPYYQYYKDLGVDAWLIHELGHHLLHLCDQYALDVSPDSISPLLLDKIPSQWRSYFNDFRVGFSDQEVMASSGLKYQEFISLQLANRKTPHDQRTTQAQMDGWETLWPGITNFVLKNSGGRIINPQKVEIFHTKKGEYEPKKLDSIPVYSGSGMPKTVSGLFEIRNGIIPRDSGTLLLLLKGDDGKDYVRWMDIRDFNIAHWKGANTMDLKVSDGQQRPEEFDWRINYSREKLPGSVVIPGIVKN